MILVKAQRYLCAPDSPPAELVRVSAFGEDEVTITQCVAGSLGGSSTSKPSAPRENLCVQTSNAMALKISVANRPSRFSITTKSLPFACIFVKKSTPATPFRKFFLRFLFHGSWRIFSPGNIPQLPRHTIGIVPEPWRFPLSIGCWRKKISCHGKGLPLCWLRCCVPWP